MLQNLLSKLISLLRITNYIKHIKINYIKKLIRNIGIKLFLNCWMRIHLHLITGIIVFFYTVLLGTQDVLSLVRKELYRLIDPLSIVFFCISVKILKSFLFRMN